MSTVPETGIDPVLTEDKENTCPDGIFCNRREEELGGAPDPIAIHRYLHPKENDFGWEDRCCQRFD